MVRGPTLTGFVCSRVNILFPSFAAGIAEAAMPSELSRGLFAAPPAKLPDLYRALRAHAITAHALRVRAPTGRTNAVIAVTLVLGKLLRRDLAASLARPATVTRRRQLSHTKLAEVKARQDARRLHRRAAALAKALSQPSPASTLAVRVEPDRRHPIPLRRVGRYPGT